MKKFDYKNKIDQEKKWYERKKDKKKRLISRILFTPPFYSPKRLSFNYSFPKKQMAKFVQRHIQGKIDKLLIAPCGSGADYKYLGNFAHRVYGIDLSPIAIKNCPSVMKVKVGDILTSGYPNESFDLIASILFFHHLLKIGFKPVLKEFHRILKKGRGLVILEPSLWYPINFISRPMKRILRNPYDEVEDEDPFRPKLMLDSLKQIGFTNIEMEAATFSHSSFYIPIAKLINRLTKSILNTKSLKYFGWLVLYWAEK